MNDHFTDIYRIAGREIKICSLYPAVHEYCREYRVPEEERQALPKGKDSFPTVYITPQDIAYENAADEKLQHFSDADLEALAVCRRIAEFMPAYDTFLFHASAAAVDGKAYLFAAESGTGKSTHTSFWRSEFGERAVMVNDDKPFIRIDGGKAFVSGNPWNGKHRLGCNAEFPLKAVCVLSRGAENTVRPLDPAEAFPTLLRQVYRPADPQMLAATLDMLDALEHGVKLYGMECNLDPGAARVAYENMR